MKHTGVTAFILIALTTVIVSPYMLHGETATTKETCLGTTLPLYLKQSMEIAQAQHSNNTAPLFQARVFDPRTDGLCLAIMLFEGPDVQKAFATLQLSAVSKSWLAATSNKTQQ